MTNDGTEPKFYSSGAVSGGYTVLRTPWRKAIFLGVSPRRDRRPVFTLHGGR